MQPYNDYSCTAWVKSNFRFGVNFFPIWCNIKTFSSNGGHLGLQIDKQKQSF